MYVSLFVCIYICLNPFEVIATEHFSDRLYRAHSPEICMKQISDAIQS